MTAPSPTEAQTPNDEAGRPVGPGRALTARPAVSWRQTARGAVGDRERPRGRLV